MTAAPWGFGLEVETRANMRCAPSAGRQAEVRQHTEGAKLGQINIGNFSTNLPVFAGKLPGHGLT